MQYVIMAEHPPQLCPSGNAQTRKIVQEGMPQLPALAERLGLNLITANIYGPDHKILMVAESADIETVREFTRVSGLYQWNTVTINATWTPEEAIESLEGMTPIF